MELRAIGAAALCLALGGCLGTGPGTKTAANEEPRDSSLYRADCYTVVLFDKHKIKKPAKDVPPEYAAFLGRWTNGAWNGKWCHDLLVTEVTADGKAEVVEMHAPELDWHQPATAFKRTARINDKGELSFAYGVENVTYKLAGDGRLMAHRTGVLGDLRAELRRPGWVPQPKPRPASIAAKAVKATSG